MAHICYSRGVEMVQGLVERRSSMEHTLHGCARSGLPTAKIHIEKLGTFKQHPIILRIVSWFIKQMAAIRYMRDIPVRHKVTRVRIFRRQIPKAMSQQRFEVAIVHGFNTGNVFAMLI